MRTVDALRALETATAAQRGLITSAQAARLDIDRTTLSRLTAAGDLTAVRRGVHALPSAATDPHLEARAAWLAGAPALFADERAGSADTPVLSHDSAARIHGIGDLIPHRHTLTTATRKQTRHADVRYVRRPLADDDVATVDGITVTGAARTVGDLAAARTDGGHLAGAVRDALARSLTNTDALAAALEPSARAYGQPDGARLLGECLRIAGPPASTAGIIRALPPDALRMLLEQAGRTAETVQQITAQ